MVVTWTNAAGGNWSVGTNWSSSPDPPAAGDDVAITLPGSYTVALDSAHNLNSLLLNDAGATLAVGNTVLFVATTLAIASGTLTFPTDSSQAIVFYGTLENAGTIAVAQGFQRLSGATTGRSFQNTGTVTITGASTLLDIAGGVSAVDLGVIDRSGGGQLELDGTVDNTGNTITLAVGSMFDQVIMGGTLFGGTVLSEGGSFLAPTSGPHPAIADLLWKGSLDLTGATVEVGSDVTFQGLDGSSPGTITLSNSNMLVDDGVVLDAVVIDAIAGANYLWDVLAGTITLGSHATLEALGAGSTVNVGSGFSNSLAELANQGSIVIVGAGALIEISSGTFQNSGQVTVSSGATFEIAAGNTAFLNTGTVELADAASTLILDGTVTATGLGSIVTNGGILQIGGLFDNTGNTLNIGPPSGFGTLRIGDSSFIETGTILGGTIAIAATGSVDFAGGTLDSVVWSGPLVLHSDNAAVSFTDGVTVLPTASGIGTIDLAGLGSRLNFRDTETLTNLALIADGPNTSGGEIVGADTLTFAPSTTLTEAIGSNGYLFVSAGSLVNQGLWTDTVGTGSFIDVSGTVTNAGTIDISGAGDAFISEARDFSNTGQLTASDGAVVFLNASSTSSDPGGTFSNSGTIALDATSTLIVGGTATGAQLASISTTGGLVELAGTLDNVGNTLSLTPGSVFANLQIGGSPFRVFFPGAGLIQGGTVVSGGANIAFHAATLDDVAWRGLLDLSAPGQNLSIVDGVDVQAIGGGPELIELTGAGNTLSFGNGTLSSTVVQLGAAGGSVTISGPNGFDFSSRLTLAADTTLDASTPGAGLIALDGNISNLGLIDDKDGDFHIGVSTQTIPVTVPADVSIIIIGPPPPPTVFDNQGTIVAAAGAASTFTIGDQVVFDNAGIIEVANGERLIIQTSTLANTGTIALAGPSEIEFSGAVAGVGTIAFSQSGGLLLFDRVGSIAATVNGWVAGEQVAVGGAGYTLGFAAGTLDVLQGGFTVAAFAVGNGYTLDDFAIHSAGTNSVIAIAPPCFAAGTRIATPHGEVAVEALNIGDIVLLASGDTAPITWIGHRTVDCRRHPAQRKVWPVRVRRRAFGNNVPCRDLRLSPDHAVFVDGALIPVRHLINGRTIVQEKCDTVAYFHVELPRHDVLLAEGLAVESYLDTGDRANFANGGETVTLHPDFTSRRWEALGCAPVVVTGAHLAAVRADLAERAAAYRAGISFSKRPSIVPAG